jgi:hypothetical protein
MSLDRRKGFAPGPASPFGGWRVRLEIAMEREAELSAEAAG